MPAAECRASVFRVLLWVAVAIGSADPVRAQLTIPYPQVVTFVSGQTATGTINNVGGTLNFTGSSSAGATTITNSQYFSFSDTATAGTSTITTSIALEFKGSSTAGAAAITNNGLFSFIENSTAGNATIVSNSSFLVADSASLGSATVTNHNWMEIYGGTAGAATIVNSSTGDLSISNSASLGTATITNDGTMTLDNTATADGATIINGTHGSILVPYYSAALNLGALSGGGQVRLEAFSSLGIGGLNTNTNFAGVISGQGAAVIKNGTGTLALTGANSFTDGATVSAGTLLANNTTGSALGTGAVNVDSGATLGGSGFIAGLTTLAGGAHLAPGNSPGTLTFKGGLTLTTGAILDFELSATSDRIVVDGGTLTGPAGSGGLTLNLSDAGGFGAGTYTLFSLTNGATLDNFDVGDFGFGATISGYSYSLGLAGNVLNLTAIAVPEPSTYAVLAGLGGLGLAAWRRRRA